MTVSPLDNAEGPLRVSVLSMGTQVSERTQLISVTVRGAINRISSATLVFADGDMPTQSFPLSDTADFTPGTEVEIRAGYGDSETSIFKGIVVRHGLHIAGNNDARLEVECRDKAVKMTVGRRNAIYIEKTDADIIQQLIGNAGLTAQVAATSPPHPQIVQHYCSDWDFMVTRAEAVGAVVIVHDGSVAVAAPDTSAAAVLKVGYGDSLIGFKAELDAQHQYVSVQAQAWDMNTQALLQGTAASPADLTQQGNLTGKTLAKVMSPQVFGLQSAAALSKAELGAWAKAQQLKSSLSRLRGSFSFQGSALAQVGKLIELEGVGERFSGPVYATAVTQHIAQGAWTTEVDFGAPAAWFAERADIEAPSAAGRLPGVDGLHTGVVVELDGDPAGENRIQVGVPTADIGKVWARLLQFHASDAFGAFFVPEVGDEVVLAWFNNDPAHPVVLGSLYSSKRKPPYTLTAENETKAVVTRCKAKVEFNDKDKVITVSTPGDNVVVISDKDKSITLSDQNGNKVELGTGGITLDSPKDITVKAKGKITLDAVGEVDITSKADVKVAGLNIGCTANVGFTGKGSATAEISASGTTTVKGAMVLIN